MTNLAPYPPPQKKINNGLSFTAAGYLRIALSSYLLGQSSVVGADDEIFTSFTLGEKFNNLSTPHGLSACSNNACSLLVRRPGNTEDLALGAGESINRRLSPMLVYTKQINK